MNLIDKLISMEEKKLELLKELKESIRYESCQYHLVQLESCLKSEKIYPLYSIEDQNLIKSFRSLESVDKFLFNRKINLSSVYQ